MTYRKNFGKRRTGERVFGEIRYFQFICTQRDTRKDWLLPFLQFQKP